MALLRTKETEDKYDEYKRAGSLDERCQLCSAPTLEEFKHFRTMKNIFPYDRIAKTNDMIITKRHVAEEGFNEEEKKELLELKHGHIGENYDFLIKATAHTKSIPAHFHLQLITVKD